MRSRFSLIKRALRDTVPVLVGYVVLGTGFGLLLGSKGLGVGWAFAMSLFIYAGSMQFAAIGLMTGGASLLTVALTTLMVNARHLFYGISMVDKYKDAGKAKPYLIFALTDETYSLVVSEKTAEIPAKDRRKYFFLVSLFDQIYWVSGSLIGGLLGSLLHFNTDGLDFALTALFLTIFVDQWKAAKSHLPALIGLIVSVLSLLIFGADSFLIPAMFGISAALLFMKKQLDVPADREGGKA